MILPPEEKKAYHPVYMYEKDWAQITLYFNILKGISNLSKTRALRDLIHSWVEREIAPSLKKIANNPGMVEARKEIKYSYPDLFEEIVDPIFHDKKPKKPTKIEDTKDTEASEFSQ